MSRRQVLRFLFLQEGLLAVLAVAAAWWWQLPLGSDVAWSPRTAGTIVVATTALLATSAGLWWGSAKLQAELSALFEEVLGALRPIDFVWVALCSGIAEEMAFRGVLQPAIGLIPSSLLFALLHIPGKRLWYYGLWAFAASLYLGSLYTWTHNLMVPIGVHVLNNGLALMVWHRGRSPAD